MSKGVQRVWSPILVVLGLVFVFSLALRIYRIDHQSFWSDEILTLKISPAPWPQMISLIERYENGKPPLYFWFMHGWLQIGDSEFLARLPSALFGAGTCVVAGLIGTFFLGREGWMMGLLFALSPFHIWYSQETRLYTLWSFCSSLAFYFHFRYCRDRRISALVLFIIFGILTCYTFPYGFFILAVTAACALWYQPSLSSKHLGLDALAHAAVFGSFVPWIHHMIHSSEISAQLYKGHDLQVLVYSFVNLFFGSSLGVPPAQLHRSISLHDHPGALLVLLIAVVTAALLFLEGLKILWRQNRNAFVFCTIGLAVFLGGPFAVSLIKPTITNNPRYALVALFPVLLAVAAFVGKARKESSIYHRGLAGLFAALVAVSLFDYYDVEAYSRDNMRAVAQAMGEDKELDAIFICDASEYLTLAHYYHGTAPIFVLEDQPDTSPEVEAMRLRDRLITVQHPALVYIRPDIGDPGLKLPGLFDSMLQRESSRQWTGITLYKYDARTSTPASL